VVSYYKSIIFGYKKADAGITVNVTKSPGNGQLRSGKYLDLVKRPEEFQSKETHFPSRLLTQNLGHDGGRLARDQAGGSRRGGGNGEMNRLIRPENVRGGNTSAGGADIEGLGELNELSAGDICPPQEDRHLQADAWRAPG